MFRRYWQKYNKFCSSNSYFNSISILYFTITNRKTNLLLFGKYLYLGILKFMIFKIIFQLSPNVMENKGWKIKER